MFLEEFDEGEANAMFSMADSITTAEIAADMTKGVAWDLAGDEYVPYRAEAMPLARAYRREQEYKSRVPFLFWA